MPTKEELRAALRERLAEITEEMNAALKGRRLAGLKPILERVGRGKLLPHWYSGLETNGALPNLDGKTIGSIIEMLLVAVLETSTFRGLGAPKLRISPARGVDLPELDLNVKSPSTNYCTSEPFFSAYERLLGSEHDVVVLLTDYQTAKETPPLRIQILASRYLTGTQVADENLCRIARLNRDWLLAGNEARAKKVFRFLAYVNQSDWLAKQLMHLVEVIRKDEAVQRAIARAPEDFEKKNRKSMREGKPLIPEEDLQTLKEIPKIMPLSVGVIEAADNWVVQTQKEAGRPPNENEWRRLLSGPLDGQIGMSFALQWRYDFGRLFKAKANEEGLCEE